MEKERVEISNQVVKEVHMREYSPDWCGSAGWVVILQTERSLF